MWELGPGGEITVTATLPESYYRTIAKAQDFGVYTLLFPGAQIGLWNWGSVEEHSRQDMTKENLRVNGKLILPGGARISFDTLSCAGERPWPDRVAYEAKHGFERANEANKKWHVQEAQKKPRFPALQPPPPIEPTDRVYVPLPLLHMFLSVYSQLPFLFNLSSILGCSASTPSPATLTTSVFVASPGAPHFTVAVKGPMTVKSYEKLEVTLRFTYHGVTRTDGEPEETGARPVTLRSWALTGSQEFSVQLRRLRSGSDGDWEDCEFDEEFQCGWYPYDDGDVEVVIGQQGDDFTSLQPGKSWETTELLNDPSDVIHLPRDSVPGDMFRYRVTRSEVDWWDWGSMEDHKETALKMFMWYRGSLTDPKDNGGRPKVLVPASDWFGFTLIE